MSEGLREVAQHLAGIWVSLLAEETQVIGAFPQLVEQGARLLEFT